MIGAWRVVRVDRTIEGTDYTAYSAQFDDENWFQFITEPEAEAAVHVLNFVDCNPKAVA